MVTDYKVQPTPQLGRNVYLRRGTSDQQTWNDTFGGAGGYHIPPEGMPEPKFVLDLGANIGLTAAHYKAMWPSAEVFMVEANPANYEMAVLNAPNCHPLLKVVAGRSRNVEFYEKGLQAEGYTLIPPSETAKGRPVYATALSTLISDLNVKHIDFCKMDVEGAEWEIFAYAPNWRDKIGSLLIELHHEGPHEDVRNRAIEALGGNEYYEIVHNPPHPLSIWVTRK